MVPVSYLSSDLKQAVVDRLPGTLPAHLCVAGVVLMIPTLELEQERVVPVHVNRVQGVWTPTGMVTLLLLAALPDYEVPLELYTRLIR